MFKKIKKFSIFVILLLSFAVLSVIYIYSKTNITVIQVAIPDSTLKQKTFSEFLKGQKITGEFISEQNYLGQVLVRFYNYHRINSDSVVFRIKDVESGDWYYENVYKTDQFVPDNLFTFGFPIINDSKDRTYYFEIESVQGKPEDAVTLSHQSPLVEVIYQYPKKSLVKDPKVLSEFVKNEIRNVSLTEDLVVGLIGYLNFIIIILLVEYLLLINLNINLRKISGAYFIVAGLILLVISSVLLYVKQPGISEQASIKGYFLIIVGVAFYLIESLIQKFKQR